MHEQVQLTGGSPIKVKWNRIPHFTFPLHSHPEYEIVYVIESFGKRFVGDSIEDFYPGDIVLVGSQVPHFWKSSEPFLREKKPEAVNCIVIQFTQDFISDAIQNYPELISIKELLSGSQHGISYSAHQNRELPNLITGLFYQTGFDRFIGLLMLLQKMTASSDKRFLSENTHNQFINYQPSEKQQRILHYLYRNYQQPISLKETANHFGMNVSAFSRYFKKSTGRTFVEYVNQMRINYACQLLKEGQINITQIAFECGFGNIANFNRFFKSHIKMTPSSYQKEISLK